MNFVISSNDNPTYIGFLSKVCEYYKTLGHNVYVAYLSDKNPPKINCDNILQINPISGFDSGVQAKLARTYAACNMEHGVYTLLDVDQIVININWLNEIIEKNKDSIINEDKDIIAIGANGYRNTLQDGKWPMYFTTSTPGGFRKLVGIPAGDSFQNFIEKFSTITDPIDTYECTRNRFDSFSDESLFRYCANKNNNLKIIHEKWDGFHQQKSSRRIDRTDKPLWEQKKLTEDQRKKILDGFFLDCFPARPYEQYQSLIDDIIETSLEYNENS